jgi:hypothetical protein
MGTLLRLMLLVWVMGPAANAMASEKSAVVVFNESGFPATDSAAPSPTRLRALLPEATFVGAAELAQILAKPATRLLVLPYGSAFPEQAWSAIQKYLEKGGNLLAIGGKPFSRAAYLEGQTWRLRPESVRFTRPLMIDQYQPVPGSRELHFQSNPDLPLALPAFTWERAHALVVRLSAKSLYKRGGSAGSLDARLTPLAWAGQDDRIAATPIVQIDHLQNGFDGGRWIFVSADLAPAFWEGPASTLIKQLATLAGEGAESFAVRPTMPLYLPGETVHLDVTWKSHGRGRGPFSIRVTLVPEAEPSHRTVMAQALRPAAITAKAPAQPGLYLIEAEGMVKGSSKVRYRSGFWVRDEAALRSGPRLSVNHDFFELDGKPLAVLGTTHMSSEVQRLFFEQPNVAVWERDLAHIRAAGLNMIRTGWWTGWDKICDGEGTPNEHALRTLEAYLLTARRYGLPVQFNFFAFLPDVLGGKNPYLDPVAIKRQTNLVSKVVERFRDVPFVAWDLINEPSFSTRLWMMRPNGDAIEKAAWNQWLDARYPDKAVLAERWNMPVANGAATLPTDAEFWSRGVYSGQNVLRSYDYFLFAHEKFADWAGALRTAIQATGSQQLITVGQDEGGVQDRPSPAFWSRATDFTSNHSWWQNDALLWDSLAAKQPGQPLLIQETGLQRELYPDEKARRSLDNEAALLERKLAMSFVRGAGAIQWLWHTNSYMTEANETPIGAVRPDGSEKPEATVLRHFATFASALSPTLRDPAPAEIAVITSQAAQFSVFADLQLEAQRKSVRSLAYHARVLPVLLAENQVAALKDARLAVLPSAQALGDRAWQALIAFVERGGSLLVTGPVERDEHWRLRGRLGELGLSAVARPLTYHQATLSLPQTAVALSFDQQKQSVVDSLAFADGRTFQEIRHGKGRIFWAADPVELAEGTEPCAALYRHVLAQVGIAPRFTLRAGISPGVLVADLPLGKNTLYVFVSEDARTQKIDLVDAPTGVRLAFDLPAERAALAIIDGTKKAVADKYGF